MLKETKRLLIRPFREEDAEAWQPILSDPEVMRYLEAPFSLEQTRRFIREFGLCTPPLVWALMGKASGCPVGHLIWHPFGDGTMELGWVLGREHWGQGLATELAEALLGEAQTDAVIECLPEQAATRRIAEKLGFSCVGEKDGLLVWRKSHL